MVTEKYFNIPIEEGIRELFKKKYPGSAKYRIIELIKEDLGLSKSASEIQKEMVEWEEKKREADKKISELQLILSQEEERKFKVLIENKEKIRDLFTLSNGSLTIGKLWEDSDEISPKIHLIGLEGYTKGDIWRLLNG